MNDAIQGKTFGKLKVIDFSHKDNKYRYNIWNVVCECGKTLKLSTASLRRKNRSTKSCGCLRKQMLNLKFDFNRKPVSVANINSLFRSYKRSAIKRNLEFAISKEQFISLTSSNCFYCNIYPSQIHNKKETNGHYIYNGIDRKDNNIGYLLENCLPCCKTCNYAKASMDTKTFTSWISKVYHFLKLT